MGSGLVHGLADDAPWDPAGRSCLRRVERRDRPILARRGLGGSGSSRRTSERAPQFPSGNFGLVFAHRLGSCHLRAARSDLRKCCQPSLPVPEALRAVVDLDVVAITRCGLCGNRRPSTGPCWNPLFWAGRNRGRSSDDCRAIRGSLPRIGGSKTQRHADEGDCSGLEHRLSRCSAICPRDRPLGVRLSGNRAVERRTLPFPSICRPEALSSVPGAAGHLGRARGRD